MRSPFDPALTQRVRQLIADKGRLSLAPEDSRFEGVCPTPEMAAVLNRVAPIAEALYLVMSADGVCSLDERVALRGALRTITDDDLSKPAIAALLDRFDSSFESEGLRESMSRIASQIAGDRDDARATLELATALLVADGDVSDDERNLLQQLAEETGQDPDAALALLG
ncbi:MAG: TerB family tellurite resistance protein [Deltaproteobacteria bacterium]|nr:TerB family tellurite resistance protein [Deltaproteobacteria bacterium]